MDSMKTAHDERGAFAGASPCRSGCAIACSLSIVLFSTLCIGQPRPPDARPTVLMMNLAPENSNDDGVFKAVRAQLSAAPVTLGRFAAVGNASGIIDAPKQASRAAAENRAAVVFWIEDGEEACTLFFYVPDASGGRVRRRTLDLNLDNPSSRFEVIAVVAAETVEGLLASAGASRPEASEPAAALPAARPEPKPPTAPERRFEIFAAYEGALFAAGRAVHGVRLGFGVFPVPHLTVSLAFTAGFPMRTVTDDIHLSVISRQIELPIAGRITVGQADFRLGVAWSVDIRTYTAQASRKSIAPRADTVKAVHALVPFLSAAWIFSDRIGLFARVGGAVAVNDDIAAIARPDGEEPVLDPFVVKLTYQLGLIIQL